MCSHMTSHVTYLRVYGGRKVLSQKPQQNLLREGHKVVQVPLHPQHLILQTGLWQYKT